MDKSIIGKSQWQYFKRVYERVVKRKYIFSSQPSFETSPPHIIYLKYMPIFQDFLSAMWRNWHVKFNSSASSKLEIFGDWSLNKLPKIFPVDKSWVSSDCSLLSLMHLLTNFRSFCIQIILSALEPYLIVLALARVLLGWVQASKISAEYVLVICSSCS